MRKLEELRYIRENVDDRKENWFEERAQNQEEENTNRNPDDKLVNTRIH